MECKRELGIRLIPARMNGLLPGLFRSSPGVGHYAASAAPPAPRPAQTDGPEPLLALGAAESPTSEGPFRSRIAACTRADRRRQTAAHSRNTPLPATHRRLPAP